jgi:membrane-associated protein
VLRRVVELLRSIPAPFALAAVFLVSALETAVFLGVVLPGEIAVIVGGALAARGRLPLVGVLVASILGPFFGDSIGYFLGGRYGPRYFRGKRRKRWSRARLWLRRRGAAALFLGRFTAFVRSIIPAAAGAARMPYRRFLPWCIAAAISWGGASTLLGYFLGKNYETLERFTRRFSLAILAAVVLGVGMYVLLRRRSLRGRRRARRRSARPRRLES